MLTDALEKLLCQPHIHHRKLVHNDEVGIHKANALAIAYYNNVVLNALDNTAFGGAAHSYVIYPDGRVVLDSSADSADPVYNLLAELREHSDLTGEKLDALSADLAQGRNGSRMLTLRGTRYYLVYESTGIQDWTILSLVPVSIVNAARNAVSFLHAFIRSPLFHFYLSYTAVRFTFL